MLPAPITDGLTSTPQHCFRPSLSVLESRIGLVECAERLLLQPSRTGPKTLKQAAARLRVAERTIYRAFVTHYGVSPRRYLIQRKLDLVRDALLAGPDRRSAIKQAAMSLGFSHLGHFAHAYHVRFGELSSETVAWAKRKTLRMTAQEVAPIPARAEPDMSEAAAGSGA